MNAAYEHVRVAPKGALAIELFKKSLEDELYSEMDGGESKDDGEAGEIGEIERG